MPPSCAHTAGWCLPRSTTSRADRAHGALPPNQGCPGQKVFGAGATRLQKRIGNTGHTYFCPAIVALLKREMRKILRVALEKPLPANSVFPRSRQWRGYAPSIRSPTRVLRNTAPRMRRVILVTQPKPYDRARRIVVAHQHPRVRRRCSRSRDCRRTPHGNGPTWCESESSVVATLLPATMPLPRHTGSETASATCILRCHRYVWSDSPQVAEWEPQRACLGAELSV